MQRVTNGVLFLALFLCGCAQLNTPLTKGDSSQATSLAELKIELPVQKLTLSNGLRVLLLQDRRLPIYSFYTLYDIGGRYEGKGTTGATHFLEHMMFKGSENYPPGFFDRFIESSGGSNNAYTSFDSTVYYQNMPSHTLKKMIDLEADRMRSILLLPEAFESERQVVLEERKMRYENSPRGKLYLTMMQEVFKGTPYGGSVIGEIEDIKGLERERMLEFFKTFYAPNNAVVVIVGDFDKSETRSWLEDSFGNIEKNPELESIKAKHDTPEAYKTQAQFKREVRIHAQSKKPMFMMSYKGEKLGTRRSYVLDLLSSMLGSGESSHLNQLYVQTQKPDLSSISVGNYNLKYNGVFYISGELLDGVSLSGFRKRLLKDSLRFCEEGVSERALQKTKNQYLVGYYDELNTNAGLASFLGLRENFFGDYRHYLKELETYSSIKIDEVKEVCQDVFADQEQIFLSVWDKHPQEKGKGE